MSLETGGSAEVSESVSSESSSGASESKSQYSAVDPGYEAEMPSDSDGDDLAALIAENKTETKPSTTVDDASDTDGETEETAETPTDDAAESDGISDELLDRAIDLGYTLEELKAFTSEKSLEKDILRSEKIQQRLQAKETGKKPAEDVKPEPKWDELIEAGHDPDIIALAKESWQESQSAKAMVQQVQQAEQLRAFNAQCERFDETLNKMEGFEKILGSGRKDELAKASPDLAANRQKVFTTMQILKRGFEEAGVKVPAEAELIEAAAMASFPKHVQQTARTRLKGDIKKAGSQALSRPHSTGAKPLSGQALATAKEADFWKKHS